MKRIDFDFHNVPTFSEPIALCLGFFDGLHLGHMELIQGATKSSLKSALLTFQMKNNTLKKHPKFLMTLEDREEFLEKIGMDYFLVLEFTEEVKDMSKEEFIEKVLIPLKAKEIYVGEDYTFGKNAEGKVETLKNYPSYPFDVHVFLSLLDEKKEKISTTMILKELEQGNVEKVTRLLNRYYTVKGKVEHGLGNGKKFLYPTANIALNAPYVLPGNGVYGGLCVFEGKTYKAMMNIGTHPTIKELNQPILEVYLFDFSRNLYGKDLQIQFCEFLREEKKFSTIRELKIQSEEDFRKIKKAKY